MPVGTSWAIGASGNDNTCTAQGFLYDWAYIAFPFYYASFSVLALVSVTHNFKEEKYAWIEKWIHLGAYIPPSIFLIYAAVATITGSSLGWRFVLFGITISLKTTKLFRVSYGM